MELERQKAGIVAYRDTSEGKREVLLLYRDRFQDLTFPKGAVDPGETPEQAAIREAKEETGYDIELIQPLTPIHYVAKGPDFPEHPCVLYHFLAKVVGGDPDARIEKHEHPRWIPIEEVERALSYENLKQFFREECTSLFNLTK